MSADSVRISEYQINSGKGIDMVAKPVARLWYRLHPSSWAIATIALAVLLAQQWIIGSYYWTGWPLVINLVYGASIFFVFVILCEYRVRRKGFLMKFGRWSAIAMLLASAASMTPALPWMKTWSLGTTRISTWPLVSSSCNRR